MVIIKTIKSVVFDYILPIYFMITYVQYRVYVRTYIPTHTHTNKQCVCYVVVIVFPWQHCFNVLVCVKTVPF